MPQLILERTSSTALLSLFILRRGKLAFDLEVKVFTSSASQIGRDLSSSYDALI